MKALYVIIPIAVLLILGAVFFTVSSGSDNDTEEITEETAATEEAEEPVETETDKADEEPEQEEAPEEESSEDNGQAEPSEEAAEDSTSDESSQNESPEDDAEENGQEDASEETTEEQNGEQSDASADNSENYTAAEQCIMSEFTECENIEANDQYHAYDNLVANGTLPQAPISDCLPCAVKYSFEAEYGESREIDTSVLPRSGEAPGEINNQLQFVRQYAFSLPGYFNDVTDDALDFYHPDTAGYSQLVANKSSGVYSNHMTYSVHIDGDEAHSDGSTDIYAYRTYSHENTDGIFESYTRYNVSESDGRFYLTNYEELDNVRIE